jgi:hypothetical protein
VKVWVPLSRDQGVQAIRQRSVSNKEVKRFQQFHYPITYLLVSLFVYNFFKDVFSNLDSAARNNWTTVIDELAKMA